MHAFKALALVTLVTLGVSAVTPAQAMVERSLCVFDIIGTNGDTFSLMRDLKTQAAGWGVNLNLKPYTDEKIAAEDLKANQCDGAVLTGLRVRQFNSFAGSMEAIGAIPSYDELKTVMQVLASDAPSIVEKMKSDAYTMGGMVPMGAVYLFVKDKEIDTLGEMAGKSISVMEYDPAQARMAAKVGMSPVLSDITNFAGRFNNNSVDICVAPAVAYSALELYKGLQPGGGIIRYSLAMVTVQVVLKTDRFPEGFDLRSRQFMLGEFDRAMTVIRNAEKEVDDKWWIDIPEQEKASHDEMMREARIGMTRDGIYDQDLVSLLKKVRCKHDASRAECTL